MLKDVTLGQYFPGQSPLHRLDPRAKILGTILYIVLVFFARSFPAYAALLAALIVLCAVSGISLKLILKGLKPVVFIAAFTAIVNLFWTAGEGAPLVEFWIVRIYPEGIYSAIFMLLRILSLVIGTSVLLTYTTTPMDLTDALERLLKPLKFIGVPVHEFAMMMTIALRFVPTLVEETQKIMNAQKARGADFESGNLIRRVKSLIPVLIPLFISSFRRADDLAIAMECRCYHGGKGRTRMKELHLRFADVLFLFSFAAFGVLLYFSTPFFASMGFYIK